jgi:hypothetical protein
VAGETIDSAAFFGMGLVYDFSHLWDKLHLYNTESVFSIFTVSFGTEEIIGVNSKIYTGRFGNNNLDFYLSPGLSLIPLFYRSEINFFNQYPPSYRKDVTYYNTIYIPPFIEAGDIYIYIDSVGPCDRIAYRKFSFDPVYWEYIYPDTDFKRQYLIGNTRVYLFRYAHTLLTYAEAMARSGQVNAKAYDCVNQIRRRAHQVDIHAASVYDLQSGLSPEAFADSVVWERAWELAGEPEGRWFDLVRLEMVEDLPELRHPEEGGPPILFDKSEYFFPLPPEDILLNPNLGNN